MDHGTLLELLMKSSHSNNPPSVFTNFRVGFEVMTVKTSLAYLEVTSVMKKSFITSATGLFRLNCYSQYDTSLKRS